MEKFLLDILGWSHLEADYLFKLFSRFKYTENSFCVLSENIGLDADECICSEGVDSLSLETIFLQNLFTDNLEDPDFQLSDNILCVESLIQETDHGRLLENLVNYNDTLLYKDAIRARELILELEEFYNSYHAKEPSINVSEMQKEEIKNSISNYIYERKTFKR